MRRTIYFLLLFSLLFASCATTQQQREERQRLVEQAINTRQFKIVVHSMQTQRYGTKRVTSDFDLTIKGDTMVSYLPYMGQVYGIVPYGGPSEGLNFTSPIRNFRQSILKHNAVCMEMNVASKEDEYYYRIDIYPNGRAYIYVRARERDTVHFDGEMVF